MTTKIVLFLALTLSATLTSGCVPMAAGAVGAVAADNAAEDRGDNLF